MNRKYIAGAIAGIVLVVAGIWLIAPNSRTARSEQKDRPAASSATEISSDELLIGNKTAGAEIVEFADFKCPSCGQFHQTSAKELREAYPDDLKIVFRPMAVIGPDSERSAIGAYCSQDQNKFVEYHDAVFDYMWDNYYKDRNYSAEFEDILTTKILTDIGSDIGINTATFVDCLDNGDKEPLVEANLSLAKQAGVRGTPSFLVNEQLVTGPQPFNVFKQLVDIQL